MKYKLGNNKQLIAALKAMGEYWREWYPRWGQIPTVIKYTIQRAVEAAQAVSPKSSFYADGGILFCGVCGTALGDANQDDTESISAGPIDIPREIE